MSEHIQFFTPLGHITMVITDGHLTHLTLDEKTHGPLNSPTHSYAKAVFDYTIGQTKAMDIPLSYQGTDFQKAVWQALLTIPYGEVRSYHDIAHYIHRPFAMRAVGQACKANPIPLVIPCHRVIGKNKSLVGYAGNKLTLKQRILHHEGIDVLR